MFLEGSISTISSDIIISNNTNKHNKYITKFLSQVKFNALTTEILTITIPSYNTRFFHDINNNTVEIIIIVCKQLEHISAQEQVYNVVYGGCSRYKLLIVNENPASMSKNVKKNMLELVQSNSMLYKFRDEILMIIGDNGVIKYYPDSLEIYDDKNISCFLEKYISTQVNTNTCLCVKDMILEMDKLGFQKITNLRNTAYSLDTSTFMDISLVNQSRSMVNRVISWLNPFAYYGNGNNTGVNSRIDKVEYYILPLSILISNLVIVKIYDNKMKVLTPVILNVPIHVQSIESDVVNNIVFKGKINDVEVDVKYNKFMVNVDVVFSKCS